MAEPCKVGKNFGLSLTGYLSLQHVKEKKGRLLLKKSDNLYWFWFDEKDCVLKYYKNKDSYTQYLHKPLGVLSMDNAKVTPAAVHEGYQNTHPNTFIITTKDGKHYGLTTDTDVTCHQWIEKLQVKRSEYAKKEDHLIKPINQTNRPKIGLVNELDLGLSSGSVQSKSFSYNNSTQMRRFFHQQLDNTLPTDFTDDPFAQFDVYIRSNSSPPPLSSIIPHASSHGSLFPTHHRLPNESECDSNERDRSKSFESSESARSLDELSQLTDYEKHLIEMRYELSETRRERDKLHRENVSLKDDLRQSQMNAMQFEDELDKAKEFIHKINSPSINFLSENENLKAVIDQLQKSLKSLDGEVELHKLTLTEKDKKIDKQKERINDLEKELLLYKANYVTLMNDSFKIPTPSPAGLPVEEPDPFEEKLKGELLQLIKNETAPDNPLADIIHTKFEDQYGDLHDWKGDSNICHFLCRHLYLHFTETEQDNLSNMWLKYLGGLKKVKGHIYEIPHDKSKRREVRNHLRKGVPHQFRTQVWSSLIHYHVGKMREIKDATAMTAKEKNYYQSLLDQPSNYQKQIHLDLFRTIPSNKHFKEGGSGSDKLLRVLIAYSNHNKNVGYCQGMNMIAAVGLLFLDEETAFWYMVTTIEKLMPQCYYSHGLAAAQADQVVIKDIIHDKLTCLHQHLESNFVDVSIVTFNWFLTFFIDALPTESMLRVIDCFLWEGRKVFFRFSLAILKLHERRLISMTDPVTIFQFIKEVVRHIFNVEDLFKIAFTEMEKFPSRNAINSKCVPHVDLFKEEWQERDKQRNEARNVISNHVLSCVASPLSQAAVVPARNKTRKQLQWECACIINESEIWLSCSERQISKLCVITSSDDGFDATSPTFNINSKVLCIKAVSNGIVLAGTLDFTLHSISATTKKELWSMKLNDSILDIIDLHDVILCGLADGYIAVVSSNGETPPTSDPILYRIGNNNVPVQCMVLTPYAHVWCGCGKAVTVISSKTHEPVKPIIMSDVCGKISKMELGSHGVWISFRASTMICLYDAQHMIKLIEVDYTLLLKSKEAVPSMYKMDHRIIAMTIINDQLWVGTGNANIHIFSANAKVLSPNDSIQQIAMSNRERTFSFEMSIQSRSMTNHCLVSINVDKTTAVPPLHSEDNNKPFAKKRTTFGKTFRHQVKKDTTSKINSIDDVTAAVYDLCHVSTSRVLPDGQEGSRVTILKPINRKGKSFVISCVNSTSVVEKAVQLWQCVSTKDPSDWNYTSLPECYECVVNSLQSSTTLTNRDTRAYSSIFSTLPNGDGSN